MLGLGNSIPLSSVILQAPVIGEIAPLRLKIWLKRGEGQTTSSGALTAWASTSPAAANFAQARAANQPSISGDEVTFSSSSTSSMSITSSGLGAFTQFTLMVVLNPNESATLSDEYIIGGSSTDMLQVYTAGGASKIRLTMNGTASNMVGSSGLATGDNDTLLTVQRAPTTGDLTMRINGVEVATGTSNISDELDVFAIGSNIGSAGSDHYDGQINEIVMYDLNLTGNNLTNAENDVMNRSNIS
tara:strand:- start:357 stop:1088 length:732 start_codon:yes stop_codon:yes gene_type:complete